TIVLAFWVGLGSVAVGAPLAWLTARTDVPGRGVIRTLVLASFVTPPFLGAFAWVMLAGPNAGLLNKLWRGATGAEDALLNIFSMPGLIFVVTTYTFPYVYIMIANTLALIASALEAAAAILGAGPVRRGAHGHAADGAAGAGERLHPGRAASAGAVRLAGHPLAAGRVSHDHHADLDVLSLPAQGRDGGGLLHPAVAGHGAAAARAEAHPRAPRLRGHRGQGRAAPHDRAG